MALLAVPAAAVAQAPPSPADVLGWELGERFTDVPDVGRYMEALADASPLVSVERYGETFEGRPLVQVLVASPEYRARLDEILAANRELTDPGTSRERAADIIRDNPAVVYLSYGVHGNETSSSEAAMWTAWDLARGAAEVAGVLDSVIVVIDPMLNPDGRARYVQFYRGARGAEPNPNPDAREHDEPWPGGRSNHFYFDLNRDWSWVSQAETRARLATWDRWNPQVHVDFHEMSPRSTYFFFPSAEPVNPIYPETTLAWGRRFGEANARAFDARGWLYFTGESYDHFYPGYGDTWPSLTGAIGMTYEQAGGGSAGLAFERADGTVLTLRDRAQHHRTTGEATLRTAAQGRTRLLEDYAAFHRDIGADEPDVLLVPATDPGPARALVALLQAQGVEVERASEAFETRARPHRGWDERREFPAGTYRVRARQPRGRLATTLLQAETELDATFSYDISAWSLPYGFGVEAQSAENVPDAGWRAAPVESSVSMAGSAAEGDAAEGAANAAAAPPPTDAAARVGYLVRPGFAAWPGIVRFLGDGGSVRVMAEPFTLGGEAYPRGTFYLPRDSDGELDERVRRAGLGERAEPAATGLTDDGPDLGTGSAAELLLPRVALLSGEGTSSGSMGATWYFLERRLGLPFDALEVSRVAGTDLSDYDVVVVPSASGLGRTLGEAGRSALEDWVRTGGTLVALARGAAEVGGWMDVTLREPPGVDEALRLDRALRTRHEREVESWEEATPGAILQATLDPQQPLAFGAAAGGVDHAMFVLSTGTSFEPAESFESVAWFADDVDKISGVVGEATLDRLRRSSWIVQRRSGRGRVVLFADDPLYRMMWYAGFQPFTNAVMLAPVF